MKQYQLNYRTNVTASIISCDTIEEGKAIIEKLTTNAVETTSKFNSVEFFISDFFTDEIVYTSKRFVISSVEDINDIDNITL
jgi:hypothetical protein